MIHVRYISVAPAALAACMALAPAQPHFTPAKAVPPDAATLQQIATKTAELRAAVNDLGGRKQVFPDVWADVAVYLKAAEWIARHGEWLTKDAPRQTLAALDAGLARAAAAKQGKAPWRDVRDRAVVRGYQSRVDGSVQPFSVTLPEGYPGDQKWRLDVVLHGRDQTLTEVKFIAQRESAKAVPKDQDYVVLEPYGRGNNAYRWAGETDVIEAVEWFAQYEQDRNREPLDRARHVLRGFSMGGAGAWHMGLHHPFAWTVIGPGAGFTTTRGYVKNLPEQLPDYQEKCLRIYDAVRYAENAYNVPVVAYSGALDPQKAAADNIESAVKGFSRQLRFTHLVAPGLEHKMPPEWQAKADVEYRRHIDRGRPFPEHVRFVTYTTRYAHFGHGFVEALDRHYEKAVVDSKWTSDRLELTTTNVRVLRLAPEGRPLPGKTIIDGQRLGLPKPGKEEGREFVRLFRKDGNWSASPQAMIPGRLAKRWSPIQPQQGPIDDAFMNRFIVIPPTGDGWHPSTTKYAKSSLDRFAAEWDKFFRGALPTQAYEAASQPPPSGNVVLFGDPASNPALAAVVEKLPITWTKDKLVVNGVEYNSATHLPALIYPNPLNPSFYVVINSGHTFHAAELQGTNAQLYPRLGDWAVLKPTPTAKDPAAAEVAAAGLFGESWQFARAERPKRGIEVVRGARVEGRKALG